MSPTPEGSNHDAVANPLAHMLAMWEEAKNADGMKDSIINELLIRYEYHQQQYAKDQKIITYAAALERENNALRAQVDRMQLSNSSGQDYILVLLDGNGMIFNDQYLRNGNDGGRQAADAITQHVGKHSGSLQFLPSRQTKIITRVYANKRSLTDALYQNNVVSHPSSLDEFFRAFSENPPFDFIDTGSAKDKTKAKIAEMLDLHLHDHRCLQIYLGCSHDDSYAGVIEQYMADPLTNTRLTLIEGPPFSSGLYLSQFRRVTFGTLFRTGKLDGATDGIPAAFPAPIGTRIFAGPSPTPPLHSVTNTPAIGSPLGNAPVIGTPVSSNAVPLLLRRPSNATTISSDPQNASEGPKTWARLAKDGNKVAQEEAVKAANLALQKKKEAERAAAELKKRIVPLERARGLLAQGIIPRNLKGQRIDPPERDYDRDHVQRVRKIKWCIVHFLSAKGCPYGKKCQHKHEPKPSDDDMEWLKLVARLQPCHHTAACDDLHCCYGHRCIAPVKDNMKGKHGRNCIMGDECKFDVCYHNIDPTIVKMVKI